MCIHLPRLPLDIFSRGTDANQPLAVSDGRGAQQRLFLGNAVAVRHGLYSGITLSAAHALCPTLIVIPRDMRQEQRALAQLAACATQFTPLVSIAPPQSVLLEVGRSAALFGGLDTLHYRICAELSELGYDTRVTGAPTPLAALFLARGGKDGIQAAATWQCQVQQLPLEVLDISVDTAQALHHLGLATLEDCQRLPRADFAKRFGIDLLTHIDQALGVLPDVRKSYTLPERFQGRVVLPAPVHDCEALLFPLRRLLLEFMAILRSKHQAAQRLTVTLEHEKHSSTTLHIALRQPSRQLAHWLMVLSERLIRQSLTAEVCAVAVHATHFSPLAPEAQDLFVTKNPAHEPNRVLIERLQARLGDDAVRGLCCVTEHRPERAWDYDNVEKLDTLAPASAEHGTPLAPPRSKKKNAAQMAASVMGHAPDHRHRPLWLLPQPVLLKQVDRRPWLQGPLTLAQGPERIESGWWEGADVARDYFVAHDTLGETVWIYREHSTPARWFLHGIFA